MSDSVLKHSKYLVDRKEGWAGTGDWSLTPPDIVDRIRVAAEEWKHELAGVSKPWLCWNINDRWCVLQQRLLLEIGWTPVIGCDPRVESCSVLSGAVKIDFNRRFDLPVMWPHFPLEFA